MLGELEWQKRGLVMDTKYYPTVGKSTPSAWTVEWTLSPEHMRENLLKSKEELKTDQLDMWYLHGVSGNQ